MRYPRFWRSVSLVVSLCGGLALAGSFLLSPEWVGQTLPWMFFCYGLLFLVAGAISAFFAHQGLRAKEALARGEDVLARWHAGPELWREFVTVEEGLRQSYGHIVNEVTAQEQFLDTGAEVMVGKEAVQVGERIFTLPRRNIPEVTRAGAFRWTSGPAYLEFYLFYPGSARTSPRQTVMRIPIPESALPQAQQAAGYYQQGRPGAQDFFHGAGDGTNPEDLSECVSCGHKTHKFASRCPQCGATLLSKRWARRAGFVLLLCGMPMTGLLGYLAYQVLPQYLNAEASLSGTPLQAIVVLGSCSLMGAFALTTMIYGIWQMWTGRRSLKVMMVMAGILEILLLLAALGSWLG